MLVPGSRKTASFPAVLSGTVGRTFVAWTEGTEKGVQVMLSRARRQGAPAAQLPSAPVNAKRTAIKTTPEAHNHQDH